MMHLQQQAEHLAASRLAVLLALRKFLTFGSSELGKQNNSYDVFAAGTDTADMRRVMV